jgi:putative glutamine amidotransferase
MHHQAVGTVAPSLATVARAPDGIVEGVEWPTDDWWMVGVQWHPEELTESPEPWDRALLSAFADVVSRARRLS